jgi:2-polyprenyl-3-methyl-5-hydroxy-6-metoxy-1,4-benzoquinol methylase
MTKLFCPITYSQKFRKIYSIKQFPIFMGVSKNIKNYNFKNLNWWINTESGNIQIHPKVSLDKLYYKSHGSGTVGKTWKDHHELFFKLVKKYLKGNICEIGGGNNSISNKIKNYSKIINFYCFDKNLQLKKKNRKIKKVTKFFNRNFFKDKNTFQADLVIHSHTFEHLYDPNKFLQDVKSILSKNGKHIFTMPNMQPMIKKGYANAMNFEHPFYYDEKLVDCLLLKNDFKIIKKKLFKEDHSIMYVTKIDDSYNTNQNKKLNNYQQYHKNFKLFKKTFELWKKEIIKINKLVKKYNNVFLFGAHVFSQLQIFNGLNKKKIMGILDNDKNKINNFLYGTNLKVYNPIILKKITQPCVILRAGSYNQEIKKKLLEINKNTLII